LPASLKGASCVQSARLLLTEKNGAYRIPVWMVLQLGADTRNVTFSPHRGGRQSSCGLKECHRKDRAVTLERKDHAIFGRDDVIDFGQSIDHLAPHVRDENAFAQKLIAAITKHGIGKVPVPGRFVGKRLADE
jgi:hypoxanthine-guanine phosphoribosyltransferase